MEAARTDVDWGDTNRHTDKQGDGKSLLGTCSVSRQEKIWNDLATSRISGLATQDAPIVVMIVKLGENNIIKRAANVLPFYSKKCPIIVRFR